MACMFWGKGEKGCVSEVVCFRASVLSCDVFQGEGEAACAERGGATAVDGTPGGEEKREGEDGMVQTPAAKKVSVGTNHVPPR